ncbi:MAG: SPOR domain-containing protein [Bacteroidetes bacterium]|nr:SPOR domain-containing protein [Bacteroidota bacterium]
METELHIDRYIVRLLQQHNCVVVPDFGGFIARHTPARLATSGLLMYPPGKVVAFNPNLCVNDGLLQQELVRQHGNNHVWAELVIRQQVLAWKNTLTQGHTLSIEGLGFINYSESLGYRFKQLALANLSPACYGLCIQKAQPMTLVKHSDNLSPALSLPHSPQIIYLEKMPASYKKFQRASIAAIALLSLSAAYLYLLSFNPRFIDQAGLNFFKVPILAEDDLNRLEQAKTADTVLVEPELGVDIQEEKPREEIGAAAGHTIKEDHAIETKQIVEDVLDAPKEEVAEKETTAEATGAMPQADNLANGFYVIASVVSSADKIGLEVSRFKEKGYKATAIPTDNGAYRISIGHFNTRDSALTFKQNILNDNNISSWILIK